MEISIENIPDSDNPNQSSEVDPMLVTMADMINEIHQAVFADRKSAAVIEQRGNENRQ